MCGVVRFLNGFGYGDGVPTIDFFRNLNIPVGVWFGGGRRRRLLIFKASARAGQMTGSDSLRRFANTGTVSK